MRDMIKMIVVLTVLGAFSGGLLAYVKDVTREQIEIQQIKFVKGPALEKIMKGSTNSPLNDRFKLKDGEVERSFFVGVFDGKPNTVAFETYGRGFKADIGLMVGINMETDKVVGIGVTTHSETPGLGSRAQTEPEFGAQFKDITLGEPVMVKKDGGKIDALSGATITSKGVCLAVTDAGAVYKRLKTQIVEQANKFKK